MIQVKKLKWIIVIGVLMSGVLVYAEEPDFLPVDAIKPGMKGYGLTVFKGTKISRFDAEILGVLKGAFPQQDLILARLSAPELKDIGVIAGMSGSPVYINDKIIGAVAYGWTYSKEPVCGITPIENMLTVLNLAESEKNKSPSKSNSRSRYKQWLFPTYEQIKIEAEELPDSALAELFGKSRTFELEPLSTPLSISQCDPRLLPFIKQIFSRYHLLPVISGRTSINNAGEPQNVKIKPGSALGVQLMSGDMDITAIGTVTYVKGDKVLAFGHPMFQGGNVNMPITNVYIFSIMPSFARPFKLGGSMMRVGALRQDRLPAVAGVLRESAPMIPLTVKVEIPEQNLNKTYSYQVWEDRDFSPSLIFTGVMESILASYKTQGDNAALMNYTILLDDGTRIKKQEFLSDPQSLSFDLFMQIRNDVASLLMNSFKEVHLKSIDYTVRFTDKAKLATILTARTDKVEYKPGEKVSITVWLQIYREQRKKITTELTLPADIDEDTYSLMILDGDARNRLEYKRAPGTKVAYNFEQLVRNIQQNFPSNSLYIVLQKPVVGLTVEGTEMAELPTSVVDVLSDASAPGLTQETTGIILVEKRIPTAYTISGKQVLTINVRRFKTY
ncbi:hypothetical protein J7M23_03470 [Candidatus Sumerlaeota bacterium]|nr:hypothetical protein [Candidatus Sumerlaeota bacterium]